MSGTGRIRQLIGTNGKTFLSKSRLDEGCSAGDDDDDGTKRVKSKHHSQRSICNFNILTVVTIDVCFCSVPFPLTVAQLNYNQHSVCFKWP